MNPTLRPPCVSAPKPGDNVHTVEGRPVRLGPLLGRGGQGAVYTVGGDPDTCVKIYFASGAPAEALRTRFDRLKRREAHRALVLPTAVLAAPWAGYVMRRVDDAEPLSALAVPPRGVRVDQWYGGTQGLRRRLLIGHALCTAFQALHKSGLSYGDLSWENVLVPKTGPPAAYLIDCDNLSVDGVPPTGIQGTPWFIAPEVIRGHHAPDAFSDQHALAVLLYHLLVLTHPLLGDAIRAGDQELEQAALGGRWALDGDPEERLPWIDHPDDARNRGRGGLPREMVLSPMMASAFHRAFGKGLWGPARAQRPAPATWLDILARAVDATVSCGCGQTYYVSKRSCPWCGAPQLPHWVLLCDHADGRRPVIAQQRRRLYPRHLRHRAPSGDEQPLAMVHVGRDGAVLEACADFIVAPHGGASELKLPAGERRPLRPGDRFRLAGQHTVWVEAKQG